jgi:hypothetical protein
LLDAVDALNALSPLMPTPVTMSLAFTDTLASEGVNANPYALTTGVKITTDACHYQIVTKPVHQYQLWARTSFDSSTGDIFFTDGSYAAPVRWVNIGPRQSAYAASVDCFSQVYPVEDTHTFAVSPYTRVATGFYGQKRTTTHTRLALGWSPNFSDIWSTDSQSWDSAATPNPAWSQAGDLGTKDLSSLGFNITAWGEEPAYNTFPYRYLKSGFPLARGPRASNTWFHYGELHLYRHLYTGLYDAYGVFHPCEIGNVSQTYSGLEMGSGAEVGNTTTVLSGDGTQIGDRIQSDTTYAPPTGLPGPTPGLGSDIVSYSGLPFANSYVQHSKAYLHDNVLTADERQAAARNMLFLRLVGIRGNAGAAPALVNPSPISSPYGANPYGGVISFSDYATFLARPRNYALFVVGVYSALAPWQFPTVMPKLEL